MQKWKLKAVKTGVYYKMKTGRGVSKNTRIIVNCRCMQLDKWALLSLFHNPITFPNKALAGQWLPQESVRERKNL